MAARPETRLGAGGSAWRAPGGQQSRAPKRRGRRRCRDLRPRITLQDVMEEDLGPLLCPGAQPGPAPNRRSPYLQRRFAVRFLAATRFIGFFFAEAFALVFTAALAI
jgi:hypothetical protein